MIKGRKLDERTGWAYIWINPEWRRCFLVLSPGVLQVFSSDQRHTLESCLFLAKSIVGVHKPFLVQDSKSLKVVLRKHVWNSLLKLITADQCLNQADVAVITIKPHKGKACLAMFSCEAEAEIWKTGVEEARLLGGGNNMKQYFRLSFKRGRALQQMVDAIDNTRGFLKTNSMLKVPFGLRWEACPPLLTLKAGLKYPCLESINVKDGIDASVCEIKSKGSAAPKQIWHDLENHKDCTDFLRSSCLNYHALEQAASMINHFKGSYQMGDSSLSNELRLEAWKATTCRIIRTLVDLILARNPSMKICCEDDDLMNQVWLASEMWVLDAIHDKIMGACKQMLATEDASLDRLLSKLEKVEPSKLGVRAEFETFVLGEACEQFRLLNRVRSPFEKALLLKKTVRCITDGIQRLVKSFGGALKDNEGLLPCTDDLVSFMLLLMARTKVKNLHANACYMENFFNLCGDNQHGELVYHVTNFSAACSYFQSIVIEELLVTSESLSPTDTFSTDISDYQQSFNSPLFSDSYRSSKASSSDMGSKNSRQLTRALNGSLSSESLSSEESIQNDVDPYKCWMDANSQDSHHDMSCIETPLFVNIFSMQKNVCLLDGNDSSEDTRSNGASLSKCRKGSSVLVGESQNFLLEPTYI